MQKLWQSKSRSGSQKLMGWWGVSCGRKTALGRRWGRFQLLPCGWGAPRVGFPQLNLRVGICLSSPRSSQQRHLGCGSSAPGENNAGPGAAAEKRGLSWAQGAVPGFPAQVEILQPGFAAPCNSSVCLVVWHRGRAAGTALRFPQLVRTRSAGAGAWCSWRSRRISLPGWYSWLADH